MKYFNKKSILFSLLLGFLVVGTTVVAANVIQHVENYFEANQENPNENTNQEIGNLGSTYTESQNDIATSTTEYGEVDNISIFNGLRQGDDQNVDANSWVREFLFKDFTDATTTPISISNDQGEVIYVQRVGIKLTGMPTSTTQMFLGTSTEDGLQDDNATQCAVTDPDDRLVALMDNILITDGSTVDATSTIFWSETYPANDTGYGTSIYGVQVNPDERIILYASTTDADCDGAELVSSDAAFDGKIFIEYGHYK